MKLGTKRNNRIGVSCSEYNEFDRFGEEHIDRKCALLFDAMMNQQTAQSPQAQKLVLWMIWGALMSAIVVYLIVLQSQKSAQSMSPSDMMMPKILAIVSAIAILISLFVRFKITNPAARQEESAKRFGILMTTSIISWALAESVSIYGLILGFMGHSMSVYGGFFVASFAAMVLLAPTFAGLKGFIKVLPDEE